MDYSPTGASVLRLSRRRPSSTAILIRASIIQAINGGCIVVPILIFILVARASRHSRRERRSRAHRHRRRRYRSIIHASKYPESRNIRQVIKRTTICTTCVYASSTPTSALETSASATLHTAASKWHGCGTSSSSWTWCTTAFHARVHLLAHLILFLYLSQWCIQRAQ
jgi:hypothetical protein